MIFCVPTAIVTSAACAVNVSHWKLAGCWGEVACISPAGRVSGTMERQVRFHPSLPTRPGDGFSPLALWLRCDIIPEKCFNCSLKTLKICRLQNIPNGQEEKCNYR